MSDQSFTLEIPDYLNSAVMTDSERSNFNRMLETFDQDSHKGRVNILTWLAATRFVEQAYTSYGADGAVTVHDSLITNMHPDISGTFSDNFLVALEYFKRGLEGEIL